MDRALTIITALGGLLSGIATIAAVVVANRVATTQKQLAQRQLLLPLWDHMANLRNINPHEPITPDVLKVVNTLELVALCVEGGMVDPQVIRRTFRETYLQLYHQVEACAAIAGLNKSGRDLLRENKAAFDFYELLIEEHRRQDKPKALT